MRLLTVFLSLCICVFNFSCDKASKKHRMDGPRKLEILFLGHDSQHHNSSAYISLLASALTKEGIHLTYTDQPNDLNTENLEKYDGLIIYANHEKITSEQEQALLGFVAQGRGFIPVHCASFCFQNSPDYINLVGGQFANHKTDTFTVDIIKKDHPIVKSLQEFSTWDETYVHQKLGKDITVLMERVEQDHNEPWTWVREHGKGRVFYTAYGHDERTWGNPGFHQLIKEGILWAVGDEAKKDWETFRKEIPTLVYRDEDNIPNYEQRNPAPKFQEPLTPEESKKLIQVPLGFDLELFASEPDIINPIAMEWDEKGRLWVIETVDYPNTVRDDKGSGDDRIKICEDTDGDGKADKFTVFADKLNIPTSLAFANGGIIVSQAPHFLFLKDNDGDNRADVRKIIIDGWGTYDTHAGPSNLRYGYDNRIWGTVGYSGFEGIIAGENRNFKQGVYRFKPDVSNFEFMTSTTNNTWGLGFTENNDVFASTANNTHSVFLGIPSKAVEAVNGVKFTSSIKIDGHYAMHPITENVRQVDVFGGFTAASGHSFYTARNYPKEYWNQIAFVCEPTGHLVHMAKIEKDGAGFIEKDGWNLFASADEWVSPVEAKVGPDGAVWILDWYNFIVQHNPTPTPDRGGYAAVNGKGNAYENPLRDKTHGRIWRVVSQDAKTYDPIALDKEEPNDLIEALSNDNLFWRITAQRLLVESGNMKVLPDLYDLVKNGKADANGNNYAAAHALWIIDGLGAVSRDDQAEKIVVQALNHKSAGVRKAAMEILSKNRLSEDVVLKSNMLQDPDANTRLTALVAVVDMSPSATVGEILYKMSLEDSINTDHWLAKAVYAAATQHKKGFTDAFLRANPGYKKAEGEIKKRESVDWNDASWKPMELPQTIEKAGLNIDGLVWFRKVVEIPMGWAGAKAVISLGPIDDSDVTWVNGIQVGSIERKRNEKRIYEIPKGILKTGKNVITIRVEDNAGNGGLYGKADEMFVEIKGKKISIAGKWNYEVEKEYDPLRVFGNMSIAETFVNAYLNPETPPQTGNTNNGSATEIRISVIKNEMKYNPKTFTVEAGKPVKIIFENPDFMQHNLVITQIGSLKKVGAAADELASKPNGADMQYVPDIPEVLFATKLVNPQQTVNLDFIAPLKEGDYPFVCTFPGHWSMMNGTMKVVAKKPAL